MSQSRTRYWIQTYGCQMNVRDSELLESQLRADGLVPAASAADADLVLVNTCSVREKAEHKLYSDLGRLRAWKREQEGTVVVAGCVAQQERERILKRMPHVDLVLGTHQVRDLGRHLADVDAGEGALVRTEWKHGDPDERLGRPDLVTSSEPSVYVTIQEGCDNVCSFCIVPFTRGREVSRPPAAIVDEVRAHVDRGAREVVLLGQNVNSYGRKFPHLPGFAELLERVHEVEGLERIRFTSPHPKDYGPDLVEAYRTLPKLCPSAHLPLQAGDDEVLERMGRGYTARHYLEIVEALRAARPEIQVSTDVIVGFPGETRAAFEETLALIREVRFAQIYAFVFSPRPRTPARGLDDPVPESEKKAWLQELFTLQQEIQAADHERFVGRTVEVLWTGWRDGVLRGRSPQGRVVHARGARRLVGRITPVDVDRATANALYGQVARVADDVGVGPMELVEPA